MPFSPRIQARGIQLLLGRVMSRVHKDLRFTDVPARTESLRVETGAGPVACTVYRPPATTDTPAPVYVNFHGGGFVVARPEQDDHICRYIAATAGCVVINVDYAVAPQRPFPAPSPRRTTSPRGSPRTVPPVAGTVRGSPWADTVPGPT